MRDYEAVFVFRAEDEIFAQGKILVQEELTKAGATILKEEDMGARELAYSVRKETRGHYYFCETQVDPEKINEINQAVRLMDPVLKNLFVRK